MSRTFLITGVSSGLGRAFATAALEAGHTVIGTVRSPDQIAAFEQFAPGRAHARVLDVTDTDAIAPTVAAIEDTVGPIDVLVNNAGYGVEGTFEETSPDTFRHQFDVNVFGVIAVTQAVLPRMRERRAGHILFVTSMGGLRANHENRQHLLHEFGRRRRRVVFDVHEKRQRQCTPTSRVAALRRRHGTPQKPVGGRG